MGFLPEDYEAPASGHYMRLNIGDNRFRVLAPAVIGNVFWCTIAGGKRRPVRRRRGEPVMNEELEIRDGEREKVKEFWAFPVWSVKEQKVQILEITQQTIQSAIVALNDSADWGNPTGYDLIIKKSGNGKDTSYAVLPGRAEPTPAAALEEFAEAAINMEALFDGDDPFSGVISEAAPQTWTAQQALTACESAGLTRLNIRNCLDQHGSKGWDAARDTPLIQDLIRRSGVSIVNRAVTQEDAEEECPFS